MPPVIDEPNWSLTRDTSRHVASVGVWCCSVDRRRSRGLEGVQGASITGRQAPDNENGPGLPQFGRSGPVSPAQSISPRTFQPHTFFTPACEYVYLHCDLAIIPSALAHFPTDVTVSFFEVK